MTLSISASSAFALAAGPFARLAGHWSGGGTITMSNGSVERIRCRGLNAVGPSGTALQQNLRCASESYQLEISANVVSRGGELSGTWTEASHNATGNVSGRASGQEITARIQGANFSAGLDLRMSGDRQIVLIRPHGNSDVASVSISLHRG